MGAYILLDYVSFPMIVSRNTLYNITGVLLLIIVSVAVTEHIRTNYLE